MRTINRNTAAEELQFINDELEKIFDSDISQLVGACRKDSEIVELRLSIANQLLKNYGGEDAMWLSDQFFTEDEGRNPVMNNGKGNPLLDCEERQKMDDKEMELCAFYLDLAGLCHDLVNHHLFALNQLKANLQQDENDEWFFDFQMNNAAFVKWIQKTPYRYIAAHVAHIMVTKNQQVIASFDPVIDQFIKTNIDPSYQLMLSDDISPDDYVTVVMDVMNKWLKHDEEADRLSLTDEELVLHDLLFGKLRSACFCDNYVDAARELITLRRSDPSATIDGIETMVSAMQDKYELRLTTAAKTGAVEFLMTL